MKENNKMLHDVNEKPPILKWILLSLQHVFAMFGAAISVVTKNINLSISGMSLAAIVGILLNLLIKEEK